MQGVLPQWMIWVRQLEEKGTEKVLKKILKKFQKPLDSYTVVSFMMFLSSEITYVEEQIC